MIVSNVSSDRPYKPTFLYRSYDKVSVIFRRVFDNGIVWQQPFALAGFTIVWLKYSLLLATSYIAVATLTYYFVLVFFNDHEESETVSHLYDFISLYYQSKKLGDQTFELLKNLFEKNNMPKEVYLEKIEGLYQQNKISPALYEQLKECISLIFARNNPEIEVDNNIYRATEKDIERFTIRLQTFLDFSPFVKKDLIRGACQYASNFTLFKKELDKMQEEGLVSETNRKNLVGIYKEIFFRSPVRHDAVKWLQSYRGKGEQVRKQEKEKLLRQKRAAIKNGYLLSNGSRIDFQLKQEHTAFIPDHPIEGIRRLTLPQKITQVIDDPISVTVQRNKKDKTAFFFNQVKDIEQQKASIDLYLRSDFSFPKQRGGHQAYDFVFSKNVQVFRSLLAGYSFCLPKNIHVISSKEALKRMSVDKIRKIFRIALYKDVRSLVFNVSANQEKRLQQVLAEEEFKGTFKEVVFCHTR